MGHCNIMSLINNINQEKVKNIPTAPLDKISSILEGLLTVDSTQHHPGNVCT